MNRLVIALATLIALSPIAALAQDQPQAVAAQSTTIAPESSASNATASQDSAEATYGLMLGIGGA
jgi:hypothetical protein